jgi:two-component system response regulator NreC
LTSREKEVLQLAVEGLSNADIAVRLFISPRTAETHRANMMRKLSLHTQTDLIKYALKKGLLPTEDIRKSS